MALTTRPKRPGRSCGSNILSLPAQSCSPSSSCSMRNPRLTSFMAWPPRASALIIPGLHPQGYLISSAKPSLPKNHKKIIVARGHGQRYHHAEGIGFGTPLATSYLTYQGRFHNLPARLTFLAYPSRGGVLFPAVL